jgi:hypothetical protein
VVLHRALGEVELRGNLAVRKSAGDQGCDLLLAVAGLSACLPDADCSGAADGGEVGSSSERAYSIASSCVIVRPSAHTPSQASSPSLTRAAGLAT